MSDDVTNELISIRRRALHYLEKQRAIHGIDTPYYIIADIEQHTREIERLMALSYVYVPHRDGLALVQPTPMPGLLALVSPELIERDQATLRQAAFDAIAFHRATLRHCWLIATAGEHGSLGAATWLAQYCTQRKITATVWQVQDALSVTETFQLIQWLLTTAVPAAQLTPNEVIADITGTTKPMTLGMWLACRDRAQVQYMVRPSLGGPSQPMVLPALSVPPTNLSQEPMP